MTSVDDWDTFCLGTKTDWGLSLSCHESKKVCLHFSLYKGRKQQFVPQFLFMGGGETPSRERQILMSAVEFSRMAPECSSSQIEKYL